MNKKINSMLMLATLGIMASGIGQSFEEEREVFVPKPPPAPSNGAKYLCDDVEIVVMKGKDPSEKYFKKFGKYPSTVKKI